MRVRTIPRTERPHLHHRPEWIGNRDDWEWLGRWYGYRIHVEPVWRGLGTALLVVSKMGMPLTNEEIIEFRDVVEDFTPVGSVYTTVSVG